MKLRNKLMLLEDFKTQEAQTDVTATTEVQAETKSDQTRTEVLSDVDAILNNLETLSAQITEGYLVNENIEEMMKGINSIFAIAKAEMMLDKYGKLLTAADPTAQKNKVTIGTAKIQAQIADITASVEGKGISPEVREKAAQEKKKLREQMSGATEKASLETEKAKNALTEFETKLGDVEGKISGDSELGKAYKAKKARLKNKVREVSLAAAAEIAAKQGKDDAAKELLKELKELEDKAKDLEKKIQSGESLGKEEVAELKGIKAYMAEVNAIMTARENVTKVTTAAKEAAEAIKESLSAFNMVILESTVGDLFAKAKSKADVAGLNQAKKLATAMKAAATAELEAVSALANKIKGKEVTKSVIGLAGGDMDKAQEGEGGFKLGEFIPKYGEGANLKKAEDLAAVKSADEVLQAVDKAVEDAEEGGGAKGKEDKKTLEDAITGFKDEISALKPEAGATEVKPQVKAALEVKQFQAELALAKLNGEDTTELETKLTNATNTAKAKPSPIKKTGNTDDLTDDQKARIKTEEDQIQARELKIREEEAKAEPNTQKIEGLRQGIVQNRKDIADIKAEQNTSLRINSKDLKIVSEASLNGLQAYDSEEDGYKWLKGEAKKMGVKLSVDKDPYGDGTDELNATGSKSALQKFAKLTGHDQDLGTEEEGAVYVIKETEETIKLDESMSVAEKFAILMNK